MVYDLTDPLSYPVANRKTKYPLIADKLRTSINAVICFKINPKVNEFPTTDSLPDPQLSFFAQIMQILFEYTNPIVSGNQVSNRNQKNGVLSTKNGKFRLPDFLIFVGI